MKTYTLNGQQLEFDETLRYLNFYVVDGGPQVQQYDMEKLLEKLEAGELEVNSDFFVLMSRWVEEAPRKRFYRNMKRKGVSVLSTEFFFESDDGEEIIDGFENMGKLAARVCEIYGIEPAKPITNTNPLVGVSTQSIIDGTA